MTRILVIDGHPDPDGSRFVHALSSVYEETVKDRHDVKKIDLARLDFPLLRSTDDWRSGQPPSAIEEAQSMIRWAEHLVFFYPLWLGDMPALLKAFLEQVMRPGFALGTGKGRMPAKLLKGRSARLVVTMGMPRLFYTLVYRAHSLKSFERNILGFTGIAPVRHSIIGSVDGDPSQRERWLTVMAKLGLQGA